MVLLISSEQIELESCACARIIAFDDGNWWLYPDELVIRGREGEARQIWSVMVVAFVALFFPFLGSGPGGNRRGRSSVEYRGNLCVCPSIGPSIQLSVCASVPPSEAPQRLAEASQRLAEASQRPTQASQGPQTASEKPLPTLGWPLRG